MICIVLAAGYATRMYPLTSNFPKPLLEVGGKKIIDWLIDDIEACGVNEFFVVSNHKFIDRFNKWSEGRGNITILDDGSIDNDHRLGAVKDILFAIEECKINDDILVVAGDNVLDFSFRYFLEFFRIKKSTCIMRYFVPQFTGPCKCGICTIDDNEKVLKMIEKPVKPESNWAVPPFYIYRKEDLHFFEDGINNGCKTDAPGSFIEWLCQRTTVHAWEMCGNRYDVGSIEGYNRINKTFKGVCLHRIERETRPLRKGK